MSVHAPKATTSERTLFLPIRHILLIAALAGIALRLSLSQDQASQPFAIDEQNLIVIDVLNLEEIAALSNPNAKNMKVPLLANGESAGGVISAPRKLEAKATIQKGDTLSSLFDQYGISQTTLVHLLSADESLLALETLKPGHALFFRYEVVDHGEEKSHQLNEMELFVHAGHRVVYRRIADDAFDYETLIREGEWSSETVIGQIDGSFYLSAQRMGLSNAEAAAVTQIFIDKVDFARVIRKGDEFQIVRNIQFIDGKPTGQTRIESARIQQRKNEFTAFLFDDGRYYDKEGQSLARAFTRTPLDKRYRVSSHFNPRRVHPVTGLVRPHNGTDFATPTGTKVLSTGDGVVARVGNHPFAGRYIDIKHGGQYKTRYLHLHKVHVRKGQSVKRGQVIAQSGNTGRSTGPHLHFELHINGRPVNPLKAKIPMSQSIAAEDKSDFALLVAKQTGLLDAPYQLADQTRKTTEVALNKNQNSEKRASE